MMHEAKFVSGPAISTTFQCTVGKLVNSLVKFLVKEVSMTSPAHYLVILPLHRMANFRPESPPATPPRPTPPLPAPPPPLPPPNSPPKKKERREERGRGG